MGTARIIATVAVLLHMATVCAQTPYPELTIQDVSWMEGTHYYAVTNTILSPATAELPTEIGASADVEFVSATEVHLLPGFHAGGFNSQGQFHARIDQGLGQPADLVIISPAPDGSSPYGSIEDNVVHVHKWEKVEVGLRLPQEYQEAINRFFAHYYPYSNDPYASAPSNTNAAHDLNPYADDSLQVVMKLTRPDGSKTYKWGFFMQENDWESSAPEAKLILDPDDPLNPYNIRFRFAPDSEGPWSFTVSVKAPFTTRSEGSPLPDIFYDGYTLYCIPPNSDNKGYLSVNPNNNRTLRFDTDEPFIGLGTNLAGPPEPAPALASVIGEIRYAYLDTLLQAFSALGSVGGNYARIFMGRGMFATEWHNLGVYDRYITSECFSPPQVGNCQTQSWAFDRVMDHARANGIYLQVCVDPYPPIIAYENESWHSQAYYKHFLHPNRDQSSGRFNMKNFFYSYEGNANPDDAQSVKLHDEGVFYYWKRKYKYIMSRWGYSVNIAALEPFNEMDQMLTYYERDLRSPLGQVNEFYSTCPPNRLLWPRDQTLKPVIKSWITDLAEYVRGSTTEEDLVDSPLGESKKLFLLSYAGNHPDDIAHYLPSTSSAVDLFDVHMGLEPKLQEPDPLLNDLYKVDERIFQGYSNAQALWQNFPTANASLSERKPFNHGEFTHSTKFTIPSWSNDVEKIFHNYDVSFHNELWSSVFSGKFAAGTSWHWPRVFWWRGALPLPPPDPLNQMQLTPFTNALPGSNNLDIGLGIPIAIPNRRIHHHFQPLADLLNRPSVQELGIFSSSFTPSVFFDDDDSDGINPIEAYYLRSDESTAIGWVHNRNASVAKSFYVRSGPLEHNFLGCTAPASSSITLLGFFSAHQHYITWFPTRIGATDLPPDIDELNPQPWWGNDPEWSSNANGELEIDLTGFFNGIADNYLDTLHSDYAFVITPYPFVKSLAPVAVKTEPDTSWDFSLYPNPTRDLITLSFADDAIKDVALLDVSGRIVARYQNIYVLMLQIPTGSLAKGAYWVRVTSGDSMKVKKMIIH
ncbi:MAG: T9SS type A sorting domain-containing protein [Flavobacteriales bacterium]|nr:T9SS type A sorting domain-containing protein [Flavobacteriales bacterium]